MTDDSAMTWRDVKKVPPPRGDWLLVYGPRGHDVAFWLQSEDTWTNGDANIPAPTHWLPLPPPPASEGE